MEEELSTLSKYIHPKGKTILDGTEGLLIM